MNKQNKDNMVKQNYREMVDTLHPAVSEKGPDKTDKTLHFNKMPYIIAEIGINHNGSLDKALDLIDMACRCGVDAVKFQKRSVDLVYSKEFLDSSRESPFGSTQRDQKFGLEFGLEEFDTIDEYCSRKGIDWFASCWDINSLHVMLGRYTWRHNKVASAMVTNLPFCKQVASYKIHTFISTGGCTLEEVGDVVTIFRDAGCSFTLMHCTALYPCPTKDLNLWMVQTLATKFPLPNVDFGYSGHSSGIMDGVAATVLGATAIEKHITLDRSSYGSDQSASLEEPGLHKMIEYIRFVVDALGDGVKIVSIDEQSVMDKLRYWR